MRLRPFQGEGERLSKKETRIKDSGLYFSYSVQPATQTTQPTDRSRTPVSATSSCLQQLSASGTAWWRFLQELQKPQPLCLQRLGQTMPSLVQMKLSLVLSCPAAMQPRNNHNLK